MTKHQTESDENEDSFEDLKSKVRELEKELNEMKKNKHTLQNINVNNIYLGVFLGIIIIIISFF